MKRFDRSADLGTLEQRVNHLQAEVERFRDDGASAGALAIVGLLLLAAIIATLRPAAAARGADGWNAATAVAGWVVALTAIFAVIYSVKLWRSATEQVRTQRRTAEAQMMLSLMTEYDQLRTEIRELQAFFQKYGEAGAVEEFRKAKQLIDPTSWFLQVIDPARFKVSRSFVKIRKLTDARYLDRTLIVGALDEAAVKVFLSNVDPLDAVINPVAYGSIGKRDREFFSELLDEYQARNRSESRE